MNMRKVVYTALFGKYDNLIEPLNLDKDCDYICFTDLEGLQSKNWNFYLVKPDAAPNIMNRRYKFLPHVYLSEYKQSLYIDSNIGLKSSTSQLFRKYLDRYNIVIPKHPFRDCIYEEIKVCLNSKKISEDQADYLSNLYENSDYPINYGLAENNIIMRNHDSQEVNKLMEDWYDFVVNKCNRDQLSLFYLSWLNSVDITYMEESSKKPNDFFYFRAHIYSSENESFLKKCVKFISYRRADNYLFFVISKSLDYIVFLYRKC